MQATDYHAKYYAYELTKRCSSDSLEKLAAQLFDARVDLNPHQVEAALFAFKSPFSKGALLADEVGLGKTIEAGIVISQKWAEKKRRILIVVPSSLRKQWAQELSEKFFISSEILELKSFNAYVNNGKPNPFLQDHAVICSYHFARNKSEYLSKVKWDLVVFDEAHHLRNVYKPGNKIARALKAALDHSPKLLLTATPLQNSLMELYGLVGFIDEYTFGDLKSFRSQFARLTNELVFDDLKERLRHVCKRTLRRQVLEYIKFTNRIPVTQEFIPSNDEEVLYDLVSEYLRQTNLQALPPSQRSLMTLVMRKLLASSTFAIAGAINSLINKLETRIKDFPIMQDENGIHIDYEDLENQEDEWSEGEGTEPLTEKLTRMDIEAIQNEIEDLKAFHDLAESITHNAKGKALIQALKIGFSKIETLGAKRKAVIFTESRRTQTYLYNLLSDSDYTGKIIMFNGSNNDPMSRQVHREWIDKYEGTDRISGSKSADQRAAIVDYFKNNAEIMIATEAAAEGINLQFCSFVVNYDLPWNPQRIEQRIGRCHRYGQKHDVVVVNFLNKNNAADQRVYQLLSEKFALFSGVFGVSDEVLGNLESGVDFEKRILAIYQTCRTPEEIQASFDRLQAELSGEIDETMQLTRQRLLENFDEEVHEKLRVNLHESTEYLNRYERMLWILSRHTLESHAEFAPENHHFTLMTCPEGLRIPLGKYRMGRYVEDAHHFRINHPLAQYLLNEAKNKATGTREVIFDYSGSPGKITICEPLVGSSGWLRAVLLSIETLEAEDHVLMAGATDSEDMLSTDQCRRLFSLPGSSGSRLYPSKQSEELLEKAIIVLEKRFLSANAERNAGYFDTEMGKLEKWAQDVKTSLEIKLKQLDSDIKTRKTEARKILSLEDKIKVHREIKEMEKKRSQMRMHLFQAQDDVDERKERLIEEIEARLNQHIYKTELFTIRWTVV